MMCLLARGPVAMVGHLISIAVAATGCAASVEPLKLPAPVAGLAHPAIVRTGIAVIFDANPTRIAVVKDRPDLSARVQKFRFAVADGSAYVDQVAPQWGHAFAQAGTYDVSLQVWDDQGGTSVAHSQLLVVSDLAASCTGTVAPQCDTGACSAGSCAKVGCAGAVACTILGPAAKCIAGQCSIN